MVSFLFFPLFAEKKHNDLCYAIYRPRENRSITKNEERYKKMIYSVSFHHKPGRKVETMWFTDRGKAEYYYESVISNPKVLDAALLGLPICQADHYDGVQTSADINEIRRWYADRR